MDRPFSHVGNFTGYMAKIAAYLSARGRPGDRILDVPAGNGRFADRMREHGFVVTCGDINAERPDYVAVNMEAPFPFVDESFDFVVCMEGVEHVLSPANLLGELSRVVKPGGEVIISLPNVQSFYSRLVYLFTGYFYNFGPDMIVQTHGAAVDRGHISPIGFAQLCYHFEERGLRPVRVDGDRVKKKILLPLYLPLAAANWLYLGWSIRRYPRYAPLRFMRSWRFFMSRSLIGVWRKSA